jgi:Arc/MetJ family transcription regulator
VYNGESLYTFATGGTIMRTNIVINDDLMAEAMRVTGIRTKREVVDTALRTLVRLEKQRSILELEGRIEWEGDLDALRQSRVIADDGEDYSADSD